MGFFSCDSTFSSQFDVFETTYAGENDGRTWQKVYDTSSTNGGGSGSAVVIPTTSLNTHNGLSVGASSAAASTSGGSSPTPVILHNKKKTPIGAIVGGVIAGLAIIGAIIAGVIFMLIKKKNKNNSVPGQGPNMAQQQPPQQAYQQPGQVQQPQNPQGQYPTVDQYNNQNLNGGTAAGAASYFAAFPGKTDAPYQQPQQGNLDYRNSVMKMGPVVTEQAMPVTPQAPQSPAPPYSQPHQDIVSPMSPPPLAASPPVEMMQPSGQYAQQPQAFHAPAQQVPQHQPPVELGTTYGVPTHNREGNPVFEAS
jgi:hypothetical protein